MTYVSGGRVQLQAVGPVGVGKMADPALPDLGAAFREVRILGEALGVTELVIDGCFVVLGDDGRPSGERLAERLGARSEAAARRLSARYPATLMVSDLLWLDGHSTMALGYEERRRLLDGLAVARPGPAWQLPPWYPGPDGPALLAAAGQQGLPGVIAKPLTGGYGDGVWLFVAA